MNNSGLDTVTAGIVSDLGFVEEMDRVRTWLNTWIEDVGPDLKPMLEWQFVEGSKYFRPLTIFGCYRAMHGSKADIPDAMIRSAAVLEMMHNMTLIVDDILDHSDERRGRRIHKFPAFPL